MLNITAKIWLSIGVFALGYILSTGLALVQGLTTEASLRRTSNALFPAAQGSQDAQAAYQQMVKAFSDAVIMQDASGLDRAAEQGRSVVENLTRVASIPGLPAERARARRNNSRPLLSNWYRRRSAPTDRC